MGIIDTIIVLTAIVILGILVVLISKQRDNLSNELFREKQNNIVQWKTLVKDFNKHFNQFAKDNKDITLEQFIEKYSKELSASEKIAEELANVLLNQLSCDKHKALKELDDHKKENNK